MALLDRRRQWLQERGSEQWSIGRAFSTRMADAVDRRETLLLRDDGEAVATFTMTSKGDADFWTPDELKESALYLGKMATSIRRRGEGLGCLMLSWAQDWAAKSGYDSLRWDVWRTNDQLQDYYRSIGGQYIRTVHAAHRWSGALFQIPARKISNLSYCVVTHSPSWADPADSAFAGASNSPPRRVANNQVMRNMEQPHHNGGS